MTAPTDAPVDLLSIHEDLLTERQQVLARLQRERGRSLLEQTDRDYLAAVHAQALSAGNSEDAETTRLLTRPFSTELPIPDYYRYTCMHVYSWFLDRYPEDPVDGALLALHETLADLVEVERAAWDEDARPQHVVERIELLTGVLAKIRAVPLDPVAGVSVGDRLRHVAADPVLGRRLALLVECSRFPRSDEHEEYIFLRSVQASEMVFFVLRRLATEVAAGMETFPARSAFRLAQANECAELVSAIFEALTTLTPEAFMTFREATGQASAVQSMNYHAMEIALFGFDPRKAEVFARIDHLVVFNDPDVQAHRSLAAAAEDAENEMLTAGWRQLDRTMARWRGSHYRFARTYLPVGTKGSGNTEGAGYVRKFMKKDVCLVGTDPYAGLPLLSGFLSY
ncbi:hypothetical protein [Kitasatospora sp. NPDC101183]|uniref:hypothetical protein n=1 Tax=Kitasatospora sp. NPDC101183 TaxID=3364100 RepID=UPI0037F68BC4